MIDGEPLVARVPVRHDGARLVGHAGVATEHEGGLDHGVGLAQTPVGIAGHVHTLEGEVVAELGMDHGCGGSSAVSASVTAGSSS